ncbi:hypothetical protein GCM10023157_29750 [Gluconacetobacter asukensis]
MGFAQARREAEQRLFGRIYKIDDIYHELKKILNVSEEKVNLIKEIEIDLEVENAIAIKENIDKVSDGDILISDMYLPEHVIRSLLEKSGLKKEFGLIVTNYGKHDGYIWRHILSDFSVRKHLGDNLHADGFRAREAGIDVEITTSFQIDAVEKVFFDIGFTALGELCREVRLTSWSPTRHERELQISQIHMNFPILLFSSIILYKICKKLGKTRILFSSRDCYAWKDLFEALFPDEFECIYYYTSRYAKTSTSKYYEHYSDSLITNETMVVDLCGSGWSLEKISEKLSSEKVDVFYIHKLPKDRKYMQGTTSKKCNFYCIIDNESVHYRTHLLEIANFSDHGMVKDVRFINNAPCPVFFPETRPKEELLYVDIQKKSFRECLSKLNIFNLNDIIATDPSVHARLIQILYKTLSNNVILHEIYAKNFFNENAAVENIIATAATSTP